MPGHKINLPFLVSLLDLVMSLATDRVYGPLLPREAVAEGRRGRNALALIQCAMRVAAPGLGASLAEGEGRGPWKL